MPTKSVKQQRQRQRRRFFRIDNLPPVLLLLVVLSSSLAITYLITDPLNHPNLHPRLVRFGTYFVHHHPRLVRMFSWAAVGLMVSLQILTAIAPVYWQFRCRKVGLLNCPPLKSGAYLNQPIRQTFPLLLPPAWKTLSEFLPGLIVKVPDVRTTHWELLEIDETHRSLCLVLRYVHDPLCIKPWRLYPRQLLCTATLTGKGVRTKAEFTYSADSPMDYKSVYAIIDQTNASVKTAMEVCNQ